MVILILMNIVDTNKIYALRRRQVTNKKRVRVGFIFLVVIVLISVTAYIAYQRPLPDAIPKITAILNIAGKKPAISWPSYGQSAFGTNEYGIMDSTIKQQAVPTASVAKAITALAVLIKKPLDLNQQGPIITINDADIASYNYYASHDGSLVYVTLGEQITEYQDAYLPGKEGIEDGGSKHTVRIDPTGKVWTSGVPLTRFDPETGKFARFVEGEYARSLWTFALQWQRRKLPNGFG